MNQPDLFQGWNLGPSGRPPEDDPPAGTPDLTRNWPTPPSWDETREVDVAPMGLVDGFDLGPGPASPEEALETIEPAAPPRPGGPEGPIPFPRIGEGIGGFRLVAELGRGAFGRVYLAEESGLGNRPVALKVTRPEGDEPRLLARLQHTHIVPIHSVRDDPESGLRLMCMPYFGGANLARVLDVAGTSPVSVATGRSLIEALDLVGKPAPSDGDRPASVRRLPGPPRSLRHAGAEPEPAPGPVSLNPLRSILDRIPWWSRSLATAPGPADEPGPIQPARRFLRESSFVRASAWIAARLAEGLEHAHSRGLLHRDLKPSNILIAADGTPMLLDFNLAAEAVGPAEGDRAMMGGTLPYMAPEHLDAFNPYGTTPPEAVDERADLYALGLILFEMVAGRHPFEDPPSGRPLLEIVREMTATRRGPAPSPRSANREVPPGLDAIIRKCLDPDPARRHARAGDLAEDLRRFLDDRPLKYTAEPSLAEVVVKWARRNPKVTSGTTVAVLATVLLATLIGGTFATLRHLRQVSARLKYRSFESRFQECQFLLNAATGPVENLGRGIGLAEEAIRQSGVDDRPGRGAEPWLARLAPAEGAEARRDLAELILLAARARVFQAQRSRSEPERRRALEAGVARLGLAERLDPGPPRALFAERAQYHAALGDAAEAARDRARAEATPPRTGRDFYLLGTALLAEGRPDRAEPLLLRAVGLDDRPFWAWFALGICHHNQGRFAEGAGDFAVCTVVAPRFAWPWMNRGIALARAGRLVEALESYGRALAIEPRFAEALAQRGQVRLEMGDAPAAVADLDRAIALGEGGTTTLAALAEALNRSGRQVEGLRQVDALIESEPDSPLLRVVRGTIRLQADRAGAEDDFRRALAARPGDPGAHLGLARLREDDPPAALPHLDAAIEGDPARFEAVELRALLRARLGDPRALDDVDRLARAPTPHRLYNAACALALLDRARPDPALAPRALDFLRRALESGFPRPTLRDDPDLAGLRPDPGFAELAGPG